MIRTQLFSDEPTVLDDIGHRSHAAEVAEMAMWCEPPFVLGIHGDWGTGKTSFLKKVHLCLAGKQTGYANADTAMKTLWGENFKPSAKVETIWFDAWRYQFESAPAVALLNEIRSHFSLSKRFVGKAGKVAYSALMSLEELGKKIGFSAENLEKAGEKWDQTHLAQPLPSQLCRDLLEKAIEDLTWNSGRRLVIFVDDLDRCMGQVAFRFLEAMKIYFSISNCVFVLGLDVRHVRRAVAAELKNAGVIPDDEKSDAFASDYLSKIFQHVFYLPRMTGQNAFLEALMAQSGLPDADEWIQMMADSRILPPNPRKIKAFVGGLIFYIRQLQDRLPDGQVLDKRLVLVFAYLRFNANEVYRILEAEPDFWKRLVDFCANGDDKGHPALKNLQLPEKAVQDEEPEKGYKYESVFPDPGDESLFRASFLIRELGKKPDPSDDDFDLYLMRSK